MLAGGVALFKGAQLIDMVAALNERRGESASIAQVQGRTVFAAIEALFAGVVLGAAALSNRARLGLWIASRASSPARPVLVGHPLGSPVRVAVVMIATPLVMTVVAGMLGRPLVLVRDFIVAVPFVSLLVAVGFDTLAPSQRRAVGLALAAFALYVNAHFEAIPWVNVNTYSLSPWLLHTHTDWRVLRRRIPANNRLPILTVRHYSTDAVGFYARVPVARIDVVAPDQPLHVSQVITDDDDLASDTPWRNDSALWSARPEAFWWLDRSARWPTTARSASKTARCTSTSSCVPDGSSPPTTASGGSSRPPCRTSWRSRCASNCRGAIRAIWAEVRARRPDDLRPRVAGHAPPRALGRLGLRPRRRHLPRVLGEHRRTSSPRRASGSPGSTSARAPSTSAPSRGRACTPWAAGCS